MSEIPVKTKVCIVVSVYNEEEVLPEFWKSLQAELKKNDRYTFEVIFVNDGSDDNSQQVIDMIAGQGNQGTMVTSIEFSKNFGHEAAMIAGLDVSDGQVMICMDADLQHPPEKITDMVGAWEKGNEIVTMIRAVRHDSSLLKNIFSRMFYRFLNSISEFDFDRDASDFFLISRKVVDILKVNYRERNRFLRGYIQSVGFPRTSLSFEAPPRSAGVSKYSFRNLLSLGGAAIFSFSNKPLKLAFWVSFIFSLFTLTVIIYSLIVFFFGEKPFSGYTTLVIFQGICFTILFALVGILSVFFGKGLDEIRNRPIYIIRELKSNKEKDR